MANLFTRDFYEAARARLRPGGVFCQWMQCYDTSPATVQTVFRTVASVFPRGRVYYLDGSADLILVAFRDEEIPLGDPVIAAGFTRGEVATSLRSLGLEAPSDLLPFYRGRLERFARDAGPGPVHTDDNGWLEYRAPFDLFRGQGSQDLLAWSREGAADLAGELRADPARGDSLLAAAAKHARAHEYAEAVRGLEMARAALSAPRATTP
jgi:spermidine synthase